MNVAPPVNRLRITSPHSSVLGDQGDGSGHEAGFTLFELLLAITLFAMISAMIYSVVTVAIRFVEKGEKKIEAIAKQQGLLTLLHRQISSAYYSSLRRRVMISSDSDGTILRLVTRSPLVNRDAGIVMAVYRFDEREKKLYYLEKKDHYNIEYDNEYVPSFEDMALLLETPVPVTMEYMDADKSVVVQYGDKTYEFQARSKIRNM